VDSGHVPRVQRLTEKEFIMNFDKPRKPVIITDVCYNWKAMSTWHLIPWLV